MTEPMIIDGRYRVLARIGSGGMADVFCAEDLQLGRRVAVKVLHRRFAEDESFVERFRLEASSAAGLSHPNVVAIYDRGTWDDTFYIVMEYLEGRSLKEVVAQDGPLPPARAVALVEQVLKAARFAHSRSIVHRDLKPHNVIVDAEDRAKVTDFGIAKAGASDLTETGSIMGTAQYLSPEQAEGRVVGPPSDLYSIGIILYELLTGRVPFDADSPVAIALKHMQEPPVPPRQLSGDISPALEAVVLRSLAKDVDQRYQNADEFLAALNAAEHAPATVVAPPVVQAPPPAREFVAAPAATEPERRRWWPVVVAALLAVIAVGAFLLLRAEQKVQVPQVVGAPQAEAQITLSRAGFSTDVTTRTSATVAEGTVMATNPAGGERAKKGSTVTMTISSGPGTVQIPDLTGRSRSEARSALTELGLKIGEETQPSDSTGENRVIETRPEAGQTVDRGFRVTLVISTGRARVDVPDVVSQKLEDARVTLESHGFTVAVERKEDAQAAPGTVLAQSPSGRARSGATVTLTVARAPAPVQVPDVTGMTQAAAKQTLAKAGFKQVTVTEQEVSDEAEAGIVLSQNPTGKAQVKNTVTITVGKLVPATTTDTTATPEA